jgi:hypothetical protein
MKVVDIIKDVIDYQGSFDHKFFKIALQHLKKIKNDIVKIPENEYLLESIRVHVCNNDYTIAISDEKIGNLFNAGAHRTLHLQYNALYNLLIQANAIGSKNIDELQPNTHIAEIIKKLPQDNNKYTIIVVFLTSDEATKNKKELAKSLYYSNDVDLSGLVLGINIFEFLQMQDITRYNKIWSMSDEAGRVKTKLTDFYNSSQNLDWKLKNSILIFSGTVLHILGLNYSDDIDLLMIANKEDSKLPEIIKKKFGYLSDKYIDIYYYLNDKKWINPREKESREYRKQWFTYTMANLGGADDIFDVLCNPKYHFYFMGLKFVTIETTLQKKRRRNNPFDYIDFIMLEKLFNIKVNPTPCLSQLMIQYGNIIMINYKRLDYIYSSIQKYILTWYTERMTIQQIKDYIPKCTYRMYMDDRKLIKTNRDSQYQELNGIFTSVHKCLYDKYKKTANPKEIVISGHNALDPVESFGHCYIEQSPDIHEYNISNGIPVSNSLMYRHIQLYKNMPKSMNNTVSLAMFSYNIFDYENISKYVENISNMIKKKGHVVLLMEDSDRILSEIQNNSNNKSRKHPHNDRFTSYKTEVMDNQEPVFGVYHIDQQQTVVYHRNMDVYAFGLTRYFINESVLISLFTKGGLHQVENTNITTLKLKSNALSGIYKEIAEYYKYIVFEKK